MSIENLAEIYRPEANITEVYLLNVPLESDYKHTIFWESSDAQQAYFQSRVVRRYTDFSYQRKDNIIRVGNVDAMGLISEYDDLLNAGVNYVMYRNTKYSNKWFYCFVKNLNYVNEGLTEIEIETDVLQTWLWDYTVKQSFVEREHVDDDAIGLHTIPEGLETGEYISNGHYDVDLGDMYIIVATTHDGTKNVQGAVYGGAYSGVQYIAFPIDKYIDVNYFLKDLAENEGAADAVTAIFLAPKFLLGQLSGVSNVVVSGTMQEYTTEARTRKYDGVLGLHTPRNNKLKTYPFNYLLVSNNNGASAVYRYEHFNCDEPEYCQFKVQGVLTPGGSIKLTPQDYKGVAENYEESLNAGKFPICNWNTDVFTNWLTQNSVNIGLSVASSALQIAGGVGMMATGAGALAGAGSMATGMLGIANTMGQVYQQSMVPPQSEGNLNCGDVVTAMGANTFTMYNMTIKTEYAQIIDKYFDMFGYKVNNVKVPNRFHRENYWFTKTIDVNIDAAIPQTDLQKIKDCYNNGITFWRSAEHIQDYSVSNKITLY